MIVLVALPCVCFAWALYRPPVWFLMRTGRRVPADFIVVPGGEPSRAVYAARCFREGVAPRVLLCGCGDAFVNRDLLVSLGVPPRAIVVESRSASTLENARFSAPILRKAGARKVAIVTSWYHSSRAYATFRHEIPDVLFVSVPVGRPTDKAADDRSFARLEVIKRVWYFLRYGVPLF